MQAQPAFSAAVALGAGDPMRGGHLGPVPPDWASLSARRAKLTPEADPETGEDCRYSGSFGGLFRTRPSKAKLR